MISVDRTKGRRTVTTTSLKFKMNTLKRHFRLRVRITTLSRRYIVAVRNVFLKEGRCYELIVSEM